MFTGFGFKGRNVILVRTCDAVVIVSGRIGTLNEFTIAYDENKVIGVLERTGGVSDLVRGILGSIEKRGGVVIYEREPKKLVGRMLQELRNRRS